MVQQKNLLQEFYKSKKRKSNASNINGNEKSEKENMGTNNTNNSKMSVGEISYSDVYRSSNSPRKKHREEKTNSFIAKFNEFTTNAKEIFPFSKLGDFTTNEADEKTGRDSTKQLQSPSKQRKDGSKGKNKRSTLKGDSEAKEGKYDSKNIKGHSSNKLGTNDSEYRKRSLNHTLDDRSMDSDSQNMSGFLNRSGDDEFSESYEDSINSVDLLKEKMEEEKKLYNKNLEEKNGKV